MVTRRALTRRVRAALLPLARQVPRTFGPAPLRLLSRDARVAAAEQLTSTDPQRAHALLEQELAPDAPARLVRTTAVAAFRAEDHARAVELLTSLLTGGEASSTDLLRLAQSAREIRDRAVLDRAQTALLQQTPATESQVRRTIAALAKIDHRHRPDLQRWRDRTAARHPGVTLAGADALIAAARASELALGGPLEASDVAELLALPEGATHLVRRLTGTRRFADLAALLPTWSQETLDSVSAAAWRWLSRHAAGHGWTALAAEAAGRVDGDSPQETTRALLAEAADEEHLLAHPWEPPVRATAPADLDTRSVLSVLGQSLPLRSGGYATRSHGILTSLAERGWQVTAVTRLGFPFDQWWQADDERVPPPVDVVDGIPYHRLLTDGVRHYPRVPLTPYVTQGAAGIVGLAREKRASLIHASSLYDVGMAGLTAARELGVPFVYEMRGLKQLLEGARLPLFTGSPRHHYLDLLEATVAREADALLVITHALGREMERMGVDPSRITVVPNGVDVDRFTPRERDQGLAERLGLADKQVIGYLGGLVHYEGLDLLFEALVRLREQRDDFHLLVVGDGAYERKLHMVVEELGVGDLITFTGRVPHEEVEDYLSLVDITPFPRKPLPVCEMISPIKPFESMAMRKAVVASDVAALAEIVQDGVTGRLFAKGDADDLARVLGELLDDPGQRARLGAAARDWVARERDWSRITDSVDGVYRQLLDPSTAS
ncbi:glycosyltransferase family 4 protein [Ornithinimicrobium murale]|uniref:glycosyltransferase family 4 protein n=1 Tax=Ornithinimicrobium murale TaxID=1050153 RepID=UPI000E0CF8AB|nr:glycosyltransferase [Ornithinimicrobium murale]